jgi:short-subunit dehydrogenase
MIASLRRLELAWSRRHVRKSELSPPPAGRRPVCIITGGSEGIGRELANQFARDGRLLLLVARSAEALRTAAEEIHRDHGVEAFTAVIDLTAPAYLERIEQVLDQHGLYADILVNNAAFGIGGAFAAQEAERLEALCRLNIEALTVLTRAFLPDMLRRAQGGVLNIASLGGLVPGPYQAAYYASKAYVVSLTEALAYENAGRGVRISVAVPGPVATRFHERMGTENAFYHDVQQVMSAEAVARIVYSGFIGRRTVIPPGLLPTFNAVAVRVVPHAILVPFIGWILKQRY